MQPTTYPGTVREVALLGLKLGFTAFGGPAAHIAMLRNEVVHRRQWVTDEHFLDLLGATNLIPGPNSTEMVMHIGQVRAGWRGLWIAGLCFILPAALLVLILAWGYVAFGSVPAFGWIMYGIKPVIIAVVAQALWGLLKTAAKTWLLAAVGITVFGLYLFRINELGLLFGGGLFIMLVRNLNRIRRGSTGVLPLFLLGGLPGLAVQVEQQVSLLRLFWAFLKIGSVLYGSGYVLLAFLRSEFVVRLGWITNQQLLDGVAIGQFTPGPLFTTATFVGYLVAGVPGAIIATVGIFLPAFIFVAAVNPLIPLLRRSPWMGAFLDGVNVAAVGLMAAVLWELGRSALVDWLTVALALAAGVLLIRFNVNSAWLVLAGGLIALVVNLLLPGMLLP